MITESGYYHTILKGIGNMTIFEDSNDYVKFLEIVRKVKDEIGFELLAYCLMSNHVHLLIGDKSNTLSLIMQKIALKYARYYNFKYRREGHLFQNRYKSELIMSDRQLLLTFRYILQNPKKAGIAESCGYKWNCYFDYCEKGGKSSFVDTELIISLFGGVKEMIAFLDVEETERGFEFCEVKKIPDEEAKKIIQKMYGENYHLKISQMQKQKRNEALKELKNLGLQIKQIERLTGIGRNIIQRA